MLIIYQHYPKILEGITMHKVSLIAMAIVISITQVACGDLDETEKIQVPKYHTESEPGQWIMEIDTHVPIVSYEGDDAIVVRVPIKPSMTPKHYIEAIVLLDGRREIASKKFSFTFEEPRARFVLPDPSRGNYRVVAKCNLHDMWIAPVNLPKREKR